MTIKVKVKTFTWKIWVILINSGLFTVHVLGLHAIEEEEKIVSNIESKSGNKRQKWKWNITPSGRHIFLLLRLLLRQSNRVLWKENIVLLYSFSFETEFVFVFFFCICIFVFVFLYLYFTWQIPIQKGCKTHVRPKMYLKENSNEFLIFCTCLFLFHKCLFVDGDIDNDDDQK